jgi:hypothetical protein
MKNPLDDCPYLGKCDWCGDRPPCIYKIKALKMLKIMALSSKESKK